MTSPQPQLTTGATANHGANLAFSSRGLHRTEILRLLGSRIGLEVPTDLAAAGPVTLDDGRTVEVQAELSLDADAMRYKVTGMAVYISPGDEIDPELLRQLRWGEMFAVGIENVSQVVTFAEDGSQTRHRSELTLTPDEQTGGLWLQARLAGVNPNSYIAERLGISNTAAAARVKRLRAAKVIPPATQGQRR